MQNLQNNNKPNLLAGKTCARSNKFWVQWLPVSILILYLLEIFTRSRIRKCKSWHPADVVIPDPILTTTPKPVTVNTHSKKNCTLPRQLSLTYGNPCVTKIYKNTTINTFIYKTESTLLQINNVYFGTVQYRFAWFHKWWYCWIIVYSIINQTVFTGAFRLEVISKGPVVDHCCQNGYEMELRILKK